jgi:hypothetical protein
MKSCRERSEQKISARGVLTILYGVTVIAKPSKRETCRWARSDFREDVHELANSLKFGP